MISDVNKQQVTPKVSPNGMIDAYEQKEIIRIRTRSLKDSLPFEQDAEAKWREQGERLAKALGVG